MARTGRIVGGGVEGGGGGGVGAAVCGNRFGLAVSLNISQLASVGGQEGRNFQFTPVAEFIDPDWGSKVNPARLHGHAGRYDNPMPELTLSPRQGSMNSATVQ